MTYQLKMTYQEFRNKWNGRYIDFDGYYGGQCWDLGQQYFTECLGLPASVLSGCGLVSNMLNEPKLSLMLKYFDEVPGNQMQPGDVCIWYYGHIAIFDNWDGKDCWYLTQNTGSAENPIGVTHIAKNGNTNMRAFRFRVSKPVNPIPFEVGTKVYPTMNVNLKSNAGYGNEEIMILNKDTECIVKGYHEKNGRYMSLGDSNGNYFSPSAWTNEFNLFTTNKPVIEEQPQNTDLNDHTDTKEEEQQNVSAKEENVTENKKTGIDEVLNDNKDSNTKNDNFIKKIINLLLKIIKCILTKKQD